MRAWYFESRRAMSWLMQEQDASCGFVSDMVLEGVVTTMAEGERLVAGRAVCTIHNGNSPQGQRLTETFRMKMGWMWEDRQGDGNVNAGLVVTTGDREVIGMSWREFWEWANASVLSAINEGRSLTEGEEA